MAQTLRAAGTAARVHREGPAPAIPGHRSYIGAGTQHGTTAREPMFGHRSWLGAPSRHIATPPPPAPGHMAWLGGEGTSTPINNQAELLPQVLAERARQALYEGCKRAPEFTPAHRNLAR